ncbi:MAG: hypothetical protein KGO82_03440 [Bacteroidota bacterium]|nr:hypothetical protein [Bacteroidota bacterium]
MTILVFKTNLRTRTMVQQISPELNQVQGILRWNVDLQDIDNVLRVEGEGITVNGIVNRLVEAGYRCEELPD